MSSPQIPGIIFLGGGIPTGTVFPFKALKLTLTDGREIELSEKEVTTQQPLAPLDTVPSEPHSIGRVHLCRCTTCSSMA